MGVDASCLSGGSCAGGSMGGNFLSGFARLLRIIYRGAGPGWANSKWVRFLSAWRAAIFRGRLDE